MGGEERKSRAEVRCVQAAFERAQAKREAAATVRRKGFERAKEAGLPVRKAVFRFPDVTDDPPGTTFLCKVDRKKWKQCNSPFKLRHLGFRRHTLRVRAIDVAGNAEAKAAKRPCQVIK